MSESPAINVKIVEAQDGDDEPGTLKYVVQEGDTLEKIAEKTGSKVDEIKANNPGLVNVGQSQIIDIKHMLPEKKPLTIDAILGLQPQAPPAGLQELPAGQAGQLLPSIAPDFGVLMEQNPSPIKIPDGLDAKIDGCKVTLSWNDRSDNETGFAIYRRRSPDQAGSQLVKIVGSNKESYVDEVPYPATYEYAVEAMGELTALPPDQIAAAGVQQVQVMESGRNQPRNDKVEPFDKCIKDPQGYKYVYINMKAVYPKKHNIDHIAAWFSINDGAPHRMPGSDKKNEYALVGLWGDYGNIEIPLPTSVLLNPDQPIIVKIWAAGYTKEAWKDRSEGPRKLGVVATSHQVNEISSKPKLIHAESTGFKARYMIWVEDVKWDAASGGATHLGIQAPSNFHEDPSVSNTRRLVWDYTNVIPPCDFILYRSYSCVGQETKIEAPIFISSGKRSYDLDFRYDSLA